MPGVAGLRIFRDREGPGGRRAGPGNRPGSSSPPPPGTPLARRPGSGRERGTGRAVAAAPVGVRAPCTRQRRCRGCRPSSSLPIAWHSAGPAADWQARGNRPASLSPPSPGTTGSPAPARGREWGTGYGFAASPLDHRHPGGPLSARAARAARPPGGPARPLSGRGYILATSSSSASARSSGVCAAVASTVGQPRRPARRAQGACPGSVYR